MTRSVLSTLERISRNVRVDDEGRLHVTGLGTKRFRLYGDPASARTTFLSTFIYLRYYLHDIDAALTLWRGESPASFLTDEEDAALGDKLRRSNRGNGYLDVGWILDASDPVRLRATKGGITLVVGASDVVGDGRASGGLVALRFPKDRPYAMRGFYCAVSDHGPPPVDDSMMRWYFHATPETAPRILRRLTHELSLGRFRFVVKAINHPRRYTRPDAVTLYVPLRDFARTRVSVLAAHGDVGDMLHDRTPAFARRVGRGLAYAQEPERSGVTMSFGQHRSTLVAEALVAAARPRTRWPARVDAIVERFARSGITMAEPHLNPPTASRAVPTSDLVHSTGIG